MKQLLHMILFMCEVRYLISDELWSDHCSRMLPSIELALAVRRSERGYEPCLAISCEDTVPQQWIKCLSP